MKRKSLIIVAFLLMLYIAPMILTSSYGRVARPAEQNPNKEFSLSSSQTIVATSGQDDYADSFLIDGVTWSVDDDLEYADFDTEITVGQLTTFNYSLYGSGYWGDGYFSVWNSTDWILLETLVETEEIHSWYNGTVSDSSCISANNIIRLGIWSEIPWDYATVDYLEITFDDDPPPIPKWNEAEEAELFFNVPLFTGAFDALLTFLGLLMIPASTLYLAHSAKNEMSMDKLFFGLIAFAIGWALFLAGIS